MEKYRDRLLRAHRAGLGDVAYLAEVDAVLGASDEFLGVLEAKFREMAVKCEPVNDLYGTGEVYRWCAACVAARGIVPYHKGDEESAIASQPPDVGGDVPGGGAV